MQNERLCCRTCLSNSGRDIFEAAAAALAASLAQACRQNGQSSMQQPTLQAAERGNQRVHVRACNVFSEAFGCSFFHL